MGDRHTVRDRAGLLTALSRHPQVVGVVEYGSRTAGSDAGGDIDVMVVIDAADVWAGTIHAWVGSTPVDLGFVTLSRLSNGPALTGWERVLLEGRVVADTHGRVTALLERLVRTDPGTASLEARAVAGMRHGARHALDKAAAALERDEVLLARLLVSSSGWWLVQHWFVVRGRSFPGERRAIETLRAEAPEVLELLEQVLLAADHRSALRSARWLAVLVLAPVGGPWRDGEVVAQHPFPGDADPVEVWSSLLSGRPLPSSAGG